MKKFQAFLKNSFSFLRISHNEKSMGPIIFQGIVDRVTFHNESNGWSVLKVSSFKDPGKLVTVLIHQEKVFPGATMEFHGDWVFHAKFGEQFKATNAIEKKPATTAAIEKYLGSGLIRGVGPPTAKKIVKFFKDETLSVFEHNIHKLLIIPGIASKKLKMITESWEEHKCIRDVMIFLQSHGLSTLYAVKIFKSY
jgi:exodeoxyribonuclease V alpha subunit